MQKPRTFKKRNCRLFCSWRRMRFTLFALSNVSVHARCSIFLPRAFLHKPGPAAAVHHACGAHLNEHRPIAHPFRLRDYTGNRVVSRAGLNEQNRPRVVPFTPAPCQWNVSVLRSSSRSRLRRAASEQANTTTPCFLKRKKNENACVWLCEGWAWLMKLRGSWSFVKPLVVRCQAVDVMITYNINFIKRS